MARPRSSWKKQLLLVGALIVIAAVLGSMSLVERFASEQDKITFYSEPNFTGKTTLVNARNVSSFRGKVKSLKVPAGFSLTINKRCNKGKVITGPYEDGNWKPCPSDDGGGFFEKGELTAEYKKVPTTQDKKSVTGLSLDNKAIAEGLDYIYYNYDTDATYIGTLGAVQTTDIREAINACNSPRTGVQCQGLTFDGTVAYLLKGYGPSRTGNNFKTFMKKSAPLPTVVGSPPASQPPALIDCSNPVAQSNIIDWYNANYYGGNSYVMQNIINSSNNNVGGVCTVTYDWAYKSSSNIRQGSDTRTFKLNSDFTVTSIVPR